MHTARLLPYYTIPLDRDPPPLDRDPPTETPWTETLPRQRPPWTQTPHEQNDWPTFVKTLPCRNFIAGGNNLTENVKHVKKE